MIKRSLRQSYMFACFAIVAGLFFAPPSALSAAHRPREHKKIVSLLDTGKTIALSPGEELVVNLPLRHYDDNYWFVAQNTGVPLKLIAGPDTRRPKNWTEFKNSTQVFYFRRESPG